MNHEPATPLPWTLETLPGFQYSRVTEPGYLEKVQKDEAYKVHAANAYPKLIAALQSIGADTTSTKMKRAENLLRELGE